MRRWSDLKRAGFTFVRLAVDPAILDGPPMRLVFVDQVRRLQSHGLAVIVSPHPVTWSVDTNPADRMRLIAFWRDLAPALRGLAPAMTFPEVLNEPVFHDDPPAWWALQHDLHAAIRAALPGDTIILTGHDWGSIAGLLALTPDTDGPDADANVVYSFHFYDPAELTSLAAYRPGLDRDALARLPFPETDQPAAKMSPAPRARPGHTRPDLILVRDRLGCRPGPRAAFRTPSHGPGVTGSRCWPANLAPVPRSIRMRGSPGCVWCGRPAPRTESDGRCGDTTT